MCYLCFSSVWSTLLTDDMQKWNYWLNLQRKKKHRNPYGVGAYLRNGDSKHSPCRSFVARTPIFWNFCSQTRCNSRRTKSRDSSSWSKFPVFVGRFHGSFTTIFTKLTAFSRKSRGFSTKWDQKILVFSLPQEYRASELLPFNINYSLSCDD
jgi:hypothetical protein